MPHGVIHDACNHRSHAKESKRKSANKLQGSTYLTEICF